MPMPYFCSANEKSFASNLDEMIMCVLVVGGGISRSVLRIRVKCVYLQRYNGSSVWQMLGNVAFNVD